MISWREPIDQQALIRQRDTMEHRGPDSAGVWRSERGHVAFGHRRLSIIDLSPGGHQPMIHRSGCVIVFNGEIYNFAVLRDELIGLGHAFTSSSDTEVMLAAYEQWGEDFVGRLHGMFAFAIYDPRREVVFAARDRAGEKPFYFRVGSGSLSFASELKALLADSGCQRRVRASALNEYLAYGYTTGAETIFQGIQRLEPGCQMRIRVDDGALSMSRYWTIPAAPGADADPDELVERLHVLLRRAVAQQLVADVPVGVLLSGGVDSSIVAALAAEVSASPVSTYTVRFPGHVALDEGPFARLVATHLGTKHVELEASDISTDMLHRLARQFDEPLADSSMIPMFMVSEEIRRHATVAIGGDGGDELFGGYRRYPQFVKTDRLRQFVPGAVRRAVAAGATRLIPDGGPGRGTLQGLAGSLGASIASAGRIFVDSERAALSPALARGSASWLSAPEGRRAAMYSDRTGIVARATAVDFSSYMVDDVLVKVDRASMLSSLEVRAPFLDASVIDFAFGEVPDHLKATASDRKVLLRRLGSRILPKELDLTRKQGFSIPLGDWLRGIWRPIVDDMASDGGVSLISAGIIRRYQTFLDAGRPVESKLFSLLMLRMWEQAYGITDVTDD